MDVGGDRNDLADRAVGAQEVGAARVAGRDADYRAGLRQPFDQVAADEPGPAENRGYPIPKGHRFLQNLISAGAPLVWGLLGSAYNEMMSGEPASSDAMSGGAAEGRDPLEHFVKKRLTEPARPNKYPLHVAQVAELVDAQVSGTCGRNVVEVRVFSWAPIPR